MNRGSSGYTKWEWVGIVLGCIFWALYMGYWVIIGLAARGGS